MHTIARAKRVSVFAALFAALVATACDQRASEQAVDLAVIDSVLSELGGTTTAQLERGQRWRMISSVAAGLPASNFLADDLPEPAARGAGLLQVYCIQCHWLPTPRMHTAEEWRILLPRMYLRSRTLGDRMGGPLTTGMVGDVVMAGLTSVEVPSPEHQDSILAYMQRNALPGALPGELTDGPGRALFLEQCAICHEAPSPSAHTAAGWDRVVQRMQATMRMMDVEPLTDRQVDSVAEYLRERAAQ
jgi:mono/diheme cytochrome c family protein